jgi:hypothetical protein
VNYDDTIITKIPTWKELITKCLKAHFHPTILFYKKLDSERSYSSFSDIQNQMTDDEMCKIMDYCINYDKESEIPYKNEECDSHRLRPYPLDKKVSDENINKIINKNGNRELKDSGFNLLVDDNKSNEKIDKNDKSDIVNINKIVPYDNNALPNLSDDEWICERPKCQNINKITNYECLSKYSLFKK